MILKDHNLDVFNSFRPLITAQTIQQPQQIGYFVNLIQRYTDPNHKQNIILQKNKQIEQDNQFVQIILQIATKAQNKPSSVLSDKERQMTNEQYIQIHHIATKHSQANNFNNSIYSLDYPDQKKCPCGCNKSEGEPLPFCQNQTQQYFFGPGIILFFFILRKYLILLVVTAVIYGIYSLTTNILLAQNVQQQCLDISDTLLWFCEYKVMSSVKNKLQQNTMMHIQLWLGLILCLIWLIGIKIIQISGSQLNERIDQYLDSSSDYCLKISNLPFGKYCENDLLQYIKFVWQNHKGEQLPDIKGVQIIYNVEFIRHKLKQIIKQATKIARMLECLNKIQMEQKQNWKAQNSKRESFLSIISKDQNIKQIKRRLKRRMMGQQQSDEYFQDINRIWKIKEDCKQSYRFQKQKILQMLKDLQECRQKFLTDSEFRSKMSSDIAFIQFKNSSQPAQFLQKLNETRNSFTLKDLQNFFFSYLSQQKYRNNQIFQKQKIEIMRAPQPSDVDWKNCQKQFRYRQTILIWLITLLVISSSFGVLVLLKYLKQNIPALNQFSILFSLSIQLFNRIIWNVICLCIQIQINKTKTEKIISTMRKSMVAQTINIIVLPMIMNVFVQDNIYGSEGLIGMTLDFQFLVFMIMFIFSIINIPHQVVRFIIKVPFLRNYVIKKKIKVVGEIEAIHQIQDILKFYQGPQFPLAGGYIYMIAITYHAIFFVHLQPTLIFYLIFNISCFFLMKKYILLRRCKISDMFDFEIFSTSCQLLQHAVLLYGIGSITFVILLKQQSSGYNYIPSIICIIVWILYMINPFLLFNRIGNMLIKQLKQNPNQKQIEKTKKKSTQVFLDICKIIKNNSNQKSMTIRKQCYYKNSGNNQLLNFEEYLISIKNIQQNNPNKRFCQKFSFNIGYGNTTIQKTLLAGSIVQKQQQSLSTFSQASQSLHIHIPKVTLPIFRIKKNLEF